MHVLRVPAEFRTPSRWWPGRSSGCEPAVILSLGQAGGRRRLSVERVAINVDDARIADNAGTTRSTSRSRRRGPAAYFATVPVKAMVAAMREAGVPADVSNSAGTFVCNHLMYGVLHFLAASGARREAGFIHVPWLEAQALARPGSRRWRSRRWCAAWRRPSPPPWTPPPM